MLRGLDPTVYEQNNSSGTHSLHAMFDTVFFFFMSTKCSIAKRMNKEWEFWVFKN
jgi:hypothetical protein